MKYLLIPIALAAGALWANAAPPGRTPGSPEPMPTPELPTPRWVDVRTTVRRKRANDSRSLSRITHIVLHHTAWDRDATPDEIAGIHLKAGYRSVGYHFLIARDGTIYHCNSYGDIGQHTGGFNTPSIGISLNGNFENQYPTPEQLNALRFLINKIQADLGPKTIIGHREAPGASTLCPGRHFPLAEMKALGKGGIAGLGKIADIRTKKRDMENPPYIDGRRHMGNGQYIGMANNTPQHQKTQYIVALSLTWKALEKGLMATTEMPIPEIPFVIKKKIPDVLVSDMEDMPVIVVELCYTKDVENDLKKVRKISRAHTTVREGFVVDFETGRCYRLSLTDNFSLVTQTNWSEVLDCGLDTDIDNISKYLKPPV